MTPYLQEVFVVGVMPDLDRPLCNISYRRYSDEGRLQYAGLLPLRSDKAGWAYRPAEHVTWPVQPKVLLREMYPLLRAVYRAYRQEIFIFYDNGSETRIFSVFPALFGLRIQEDGRDHERPRMGADETQPREVA